jgi:hypothetical protein
MNSRWTFQGESCRNRAVKSLVKWLVILVLILGILAVFSTWKEHHDAKVAEARRRELSERHEAEQRRNALIANPPEQQPPEQRVSAPPINRQAEYTFRQIAERNRVEVLEYRAVSAREVVVSLRTRNQTGIGDLLDEATREGVMLDFDLPMTDQNNHTAVDPTSGALIYSTRTILQIPL